MGVNEVTQIISNLGFPIVTTLGMAWFIVHDKKQTNETLDKLRQSIDNNTLALVRFIDKE